MSDLEENDSITACFDRLRAGDPDAAAELWSTFFCRLTAVARQQLSQRRVSDEEDVAAGVMMTLCHAADHGGLPSIENRDDLWRVLLTWTQHDCIDVVRRENRVKRGGGQVRGDSVFVGTDDGFDRIASAAPTAETLAEMNEQYDRLLDRLGDDTLRQIAIEKLEGHTNEEIANMRNVSIRTIERKLAMIRRRWAG